MNYLGLKQFVISMDRCWKRWSPPPNLKVSEWAEERRYLSPESSAEPGRWQNDRAPYQREMMDVVNDPLIRDITVMSAAQIGKTDCMINNVIGYHIDQDPAPILLIMPTKELAEGYSKDRLAPMIRDTPVLHGKVSDVKSRDRNNTLLHKKYPGGHITIGGANSPSGLSSRPIRILLCDEVDKYPQSAGSEGDPISLANKRTTTFWNRKKIVTSTPTIDGVSRIQIEYNRSDQRHYYVPCPHCQEYHLLAWDRIVWEKDEDDKHLPETAAHACPHCGALQTDADLPGMLQLGQWRKHAPENQGHAGFHINELYSPWVRFADTVKNFLLVKNDPEQLKTWTNTALGEVWQEAKNVSEAEELMERRENYDADLVPMDAVCITAGVDVQDDRLEFETIAWGIDKENWSLEYVVIPGDPTQPDVWGALDVHLHKTYTHESGYQLRIMACGIDTGGHCTDAVYKFCKPRWGQRVFALKGDGGQGKPLVSRPSTSNYGKVKLYKVGTDTAKDIFLGNITQQEPGPGYCHFPYTYEKDYFDQLLSERPEVKYSRGKRTRSWKLKRQGMRNEALDRRVYAMAALEILGIDLNETIKRFEERIQTPAGTPQAEQKDNKPAHRVKVRSGGYGRDYARTG